jgi:hypothetical protein
MEKSNKISSDIGIFVVDNCPDSYMISERYKLCNNNLSIAGPYFHMVASTCILSVDLKLQVLNTPSVANLHYLR